MSNWMTVHMTDDNTPNVHITGLDENHKYIFRVKAVNAAGASEPSEATDEIVCKLRKQRAKILRDSLKDVKVRSFNPLAHLTAFSLTSICKVGDAISRNGGDMKKNILDSQSDVSTFLLCYMRLS